jgi:hypothetical protein
MVFLTPGTGIKGIFPLGMTLAKGIVAPVGSIRRFNK